MNSGPLGSAFSGADVAVMAGGGAGSAAGGVAGGGSTVDGGFWPSPTECVWMMVGELLSGATTGATVASLVGSVAAGAGAVLGAGVAGGCGAGGGGLGAAGGGGGVGTSFLGAGATGGGGGGGGSGGSWPSASCGATKAQRNAPTTMSRHADFIVPPGRGRCFWAEAKAAGGCGSRAPAGPYVELPLG